jgi:SAM-dependent methyltransferase
MFLSRDGRSGAYKNPGSAVDFQSLLPRSTYNKEVLIDEIERHLKVDDFPIPPTHLREHYHGDRHHDYWVSGIRDYTRVMNYWQQYTGRETLSSYFDMGGSSGRVARHFACMHPNANIYLSDLGIDSIEWAIAHLPDNIRAFQSTVLPFLPLQDNSIDLITAFSVFTHIDYHEYGWLAELARVVSHDGLLYITAMTEETWDACMAIDWRYNGLIKSVDGFNEYPRGTSMPKDQGRIPFTSKSGYGSTFHRKSHIRKVWGRYFEILDIVVHPDVLNNGEQSLVILRPKK